MQKLEVFDPAMCCSTGVCGVDVDPVLAQFAADLKWVEEHGVSVVRHNLGQEPQVFAANPDIVKEMEAGMDRLPILVVDGRIVATGSYPSRVQLAQKLGLPTENAGKKVIGIATAPCGAQNSGCC
jgi:Arsenical resistance operon protein ArsD